MLSLIKIPSLVIELHFHHRYLCLSRQMNLQIFEIVENKTEKIRKVVEKFIGRRDYIQITITKGKHIFLTASYIIIIHV